MSSNIRALVRSLFLAALALAVLAGCVAPAQVVVPQPSAYDRSFAAIVGAMNDQQVRITGQDQSTGVVTGVRSGIELVATVQPQPDGSARIDLKTRGAITQDPQLIDRITAADNARMGR